MNIKLLIKLSLVNVIRSSSSLEPDGLREEGPPKSLSFCHHAKHLPDGSKMKSRLPG